MKFDSVEYQIGSHFLSALINGDSSGLTDDEDLDLAVWELHATAEREGGHWATTDSRDEFARCDVTGLYGDVETVLYMFPVKEPTK